MKKNNFLSVILIFLILLYPIFSYAQEIKSSNIFNQNEETLSNQLIEQETPEISPTIAIQPYLPYSTSETIQSHDLTTTYNENIYNEENSSHDIYPKDATDSALYNTAEFVNLIATKSAVVDIVIDSVNDITLSRTTDILDATGGNIANTNISLSGPIVINTGPAKAKADIVTIVNTNIVGQGIYPVIMSLFDDTKGLDLSYLICCQQNILPITAPVVLFNDNSTGNNIRVLTENELSQKIQINNSNKLSLTNDITLNALTGENKAIDNIGYGTKIKTGDAEAVLNMFTMANTNIVGKCGIFAIINLFTKQTGDIILPYEELYIDYIRQLNVDGKATQNEKNGNDIEKFVEYEKSSIINNSNDINLSTKVKNYANTGNNKIENSINFTLPAEIKTGSTLNDIKLFDIFNTNITGDGFLYIKINHNGLWKGEIDGWTGPIIQLEGSTILIDQTAPTSPLFEELGFQNLFYSKENELSYSSYSKDVGIVSVSNENLASIVNNITLKADSGENEAGRFNANIETGNASITARIANVINTNIIGQNFIFAIINVFDTFTGNIIFPRPDLDIEKKANVFYATKDDNIEFTITIKNNGRIAANSVVLTDILPQELSFLHSNLNPTNINNNIISWNIESLKPKERITINYSTKVNSPSNKTIKNSASVLTKTRETIKDNNSTSVSIELRTNSEQQSHNTENKNSSIALSTNSSITTSTILLENNSQKKQIKNNNNEIFDTPQKIFSPYKGSILGNKKQQKKGSLLPSSVRISTEAIPLFAILFYLLGIITALSLSRRYLKKH